MRVENQEKEDVLEQREKLKITNTLTN